MDAMNPALGMSHRQGDIHPQQHREQPAFGLHARPVLRSPSSFQNRQGVRVSVIGHAQIKQAGHVSLDARMDGMSVSGFSLFLDFQLRLLESYQLTLRIFRHGKLHVVEVQAQCVYALLVRANGFRHGFEFIGRDDRAEEALWTILS